MIAAGPTAIRSPAIGQPPEICVRSKVSRGVSTGTREKKESAAIVSSGSFRRRSMKSGMKTPSSDRATPRGKHRT